MGMAEVGEYSEGFLYVPIWRLINRDCDCLKSRFVAGSQGDKVRRYSVLQNL